jgi:periplasmic divalent cation tolerance protein
MGYTGFNDILEFGLPMSDANTLVLVITTVESASDAEKLAQTLLDQSLAACVQIDGPITSRYRWAGRVESANEFRLMIKTSASAWPLLKEKLAKLHPYDEPEIIMLPITDATEGYRDWVIDQTT